MHQIHMDDRLYKKAQQRAAEAGYSSVDEYIADIVNDDLSDEDIDRLFTPERLALIDEAVEQYKTGKAIPGEQVWKHLEDKFKA